MSTPVCKVLRMQTFFLGFPWYSQSHVTSAPWTGPLAVSWSWELQFVFAHGANQAIKCNYIIINLQVNSQISTKNVTLKPLKMMCGQYDRLWPKWVKHIIFSWMNYCSSHLLFRIQYSFWLTSPPTNFELQKPFNYQNVQLFNFGFPIYYTFGTCIQFLKILYGFEIITVLVLARLLSL